MKGYGGDEEGDGDDGSESLWYRGYGGRDCERKSVLGNYQRKSGRPCRVLVAFECHRWLLPTNAMAGLRLLTNDCVDDPATLRNIHSRLVS